MDTKATEGPNAQFRSRDVALSAFIDEMAADLAANAADLALLVDHRGVIRDAAYSGDEFADEDAVDSWIGRKWIELVQDDSRDKISALLNAPAHAGKRRWRHVNHAQPGGHDLPVRYFTLPTGREGWTLAIGRDLRAAARMQKRLIEAQRAMEQDYARVREAETRFRLLFQLSSEGVIIVEGASSKVTDVNAAAARLLGRPAQRLEGRTLDGVFGPARSEAVRETLAVARKTGRTERVELTLEGAHQPCQLSASIYRQGRDVHYLVRIAEMNAPAAAQSGASLARLAAILPDGLVLTGEDGKILSVNEAFADIVQLSDVKAAAGTPVETYLGRTETEVNVLMANLREHGVIRNFATMVRSQHDLREPVEVSAVAAPGPSGTVYGFSIRPVGRRLVAGRRESGAAMPASVDQLTDLVGRVALKDIVRESTDMIEQSCIEAALALTNDNRASAAEILGLSRQSLYAKMHRHKIGELTPKPEH
ncbi:transcriptional regulator PpsR [Alkalicaulis satelles]|uniref:Transcriptional regulator PpsR n=1 Tax=Alkalicaulis satelles TaxID=2609175 RepID=A0A5M6ZI78_9PROT|nr:transcriptional regulator PpsR [Alkalicaulis satelles]KAA5804020.1 transcriptional regulator PpsR [Alkalicaulis satelles]